MFSASVCMYLPTQNVYGFKDSKPAIILKAEKNMFSTCHSCGIQMQMKGFRVQTFSQNYINS